MLTFEWLWVWWLLPLPMVFWLILPAAKRQQSALKVPFFQGIKPLSQGSSSEHRRHWLGGLLLTLIWLALLASASRPTWVGEPIELPVSGRDLLIAVDISGSMDTQDMIISGQALDRLSVVKYVVGEFVKRRAQDRLGLILFGTNAYLQSPLTFDRDTVGTLLQEAQTRFAGEKTAIGEAVGLAVKRLKDRPESNRVLILLTDGANTAGAVTPMKAADLAKQAGVKIYTIGVGADVSARSLLSNPFARRSAVSDLDEETLYNIAETTGGQYFRARNPQELMNIYAELDALEPIKQEAEVFRPTKALYYYPLAVALLLSGLWALTSLFIPLFRRLGTNKAHANL
ncbi:vWA domain-containing protein [Marinibactrum halimedae]|uniref:VWFA domain-containing protein n=1 Tax=Marinibactrum halimedae TaxID=1444977 RepID=A0AA37T3U1_9GAMM|nr:VWA domain-containing protein [Marinibactrum halimedae]MCD9458583.1 VWA domain-containing protein [Marinibactrum halimedae]GLS26549.1 hypothetical protein GCM10007877_22650 [Marinibactrum halimedae]